MTYSHAYIDKLRISVTPSDEWLWRQIYKEAFPGHTFLQSIAPNTELQLLGVDRVVHFKNGKSILIDEKRREKEYDDILIEYASIGGTGNPGWITKDLYCDYIAYLFRHSHRCFFLPFDTLQRVWHKMNKEFLQKYGTVRAKNNGWETLSCPVPIDVLLQAIADCSVIQVLGQGEEIY